MQITLDDITSVARIVYSDMGGERAGCDIYCRNIQAYMTV
jgi:hypothetical protein